MEKTNNEIRTGLFSQEEVDKLIAESEELCEKVEKIAIRVLSGVSDSELKFENRLFDLKHAITLRLNRIFLPLVGPLNELREGIQEKGNPNVSDLTKISLDFLLLDKIRDKYYKKILEAIPKLFPEGYPEVNKKYKKTA